MNLTIEGRLMDKIGELEAEFETAKTNLKDCRKAYTVGLSREKKLEVENERLRRSLTNITDGVKDPKWVAADALKEGG